MCIEEMPNSIIQLFDILLFNKVLHTLSVRIYVITVLILIQWETCIKYI